MREVTRLVWREKKDVILSILAGFIAGIAAVGLFSASGYLLSKAALKTPLYALIILTSTVKLLGFTRALARYIERYVSHRATFTILSNLRVSFFEKLEPLAPAIFGTYRSGDLLARITGDVETLQHYFLRVLYPPVVMMMVFLSTVLFTVYFSVATTVILLVGLVVTTFIIPYYILRKQRKADVKVRSERSKLATYTTEVLHGYRDLKIHQKLRDKEHTLNDTSEVYIHEQEKEADHILLGQSVNTFMSLVITWAVLGVGAYLVACGELDGIFLAMLVMIAITVFEDIDAMAILPIYLNDSKQATERLQAVQARNDSVGQFRADGKAVGTDHGTSGQFQTVREKDEGTRPNASRDATSGNCDLPGGAHPDSSRNAASGNHALLDNAAPHAARDATLWNCDLPDSTAFSFYMNGVDFTFPGEWRKTLSDITIALPAGSKTAIVGPSGSGKSALLHLLLNMHPADSGTIHVAGESIDMIQNENLWEACNVVLQENHFFYGTIRSNLQLAQDGLTEAAMAAVLQKVQLGHFSLDDPVFEKGENLSGGEKQRLAIARSFLKPGRNWFLDEPTSSIDAVTEASIFRHLFDHSRDDTFVLISHQLRGLEAMDQIIVMDNGKIVESGTFSGLMQQEGYFYKMKNIEKDLF